MDTIYVYRLEDKVFLKNIVTSSICEIDCNTFDSVEPAELIVDIDEVTPFISKEDDSGKCLSIYIVTTLSCNLTCSYCFENGRDRNVTLKIADADAVVNYILKQSKAISAKSIDITFTGGEPLYNFKFIEEVCKLLESRVKLPIVFRIITNGTILTKKILKFLDTYHFDMQISFDGSQHYHDLERCNRLGKGTYYRILENLKNILALCPNVQVQARTNISALNYNSIEDLIKDLSIFSSFENFFVYFDFVAVPETSDLYLNETQKISIFKLLTDIFNDYGVELQDTVSMGGYCMYKNSEAITINADGSLYNCYSLVGEDEYVVGSILDDSDIKGEGSMCEQVSCPYYKLCYGGCPYNEFAKNNNMYRDCQFNYLDATNKIVFLHELGISTNNWSQVEVLKYKIGG